MGCVLGQKRTRIVAMSTLHQDQVFTSTHNIRNIYEFEKILGHGSFGSVKLARHKINQNLVAIKILDKAKLAGRESLLATEIYILQKLDHPNVIKFYEVYQDSRFLYICMENCVGGELLELVGHKTKPLTEGEVQTIMKKLTSAISYIHEQGIVHRDIKAENIMFSAKSVLSEPKLIDFGLSNKFDQNHLKRLNSFVGTPIYISPDVISGEYDEKTDIWSLGVLIYILLSGFPPFYGKNQKLLFNSIQNQQLIFDKKSWKNTSEEARDLLVRMLQKDPHKRLTAKQSLQHKWFQMKFENSNQILNKQNSIEQNQNIMKILRNFRNGAKFKKEVRKVLLNQMNENELQSLKQAFQLIDIDGSGTISVDELYQAMIQQVLVQIIFDKGQQTSIEEIKQIATTISMSEDNLFNSPSQISENSPDLFITYSDFLAAAIDERKMLTNEKMWSLFKYFDTQGNHYLAQNDIQEAFARHGRQLSKDKLDEMIREIDPNHDGKISFEEFKQMMGNEGVEQTLQIND